MFAKCTHSSLFLSYTLRSVGRQPLHRKNLLDVPIKAIDNRLEPTLRQHFHGRRIAPFGDVSRPTILKKLWSIMFEKHLLATNVISSGVLMVIGDMAAQECENRHNDTKNEYRYDLKRIGQMFVVGALQGPLHHYVYGWMDRRWPALSRRNAFKKILVDQFFMSPVCIILFFYTACLLERKSMRATNQELKDKFIYIYITDWLVWPAAQYVNFRYLDNKYRVLFVNTCTALYNVFLSYMKHDFNVEVV